MTDLLSVMLQMFSLVLSLSVCGELKGLLSIPINLDVWD